VVGVGLVVERGHLAIARRPVQADGLDEGAVGFQPQGADPPGRRVRLQLGEEPTPETDPSRRGGDPHPFDFGRGAAVEFERAAADRLAVQGGDQQEARGRGQLAVVGGDAAVGVEAAVEAA
jgi:hypothetical protein